MTKRFWEPSMGEQAAELSDSITAQTEEEQLDDIAAEIDRLHSEHSLSDEAADYLSALLEQQRQIVRTFGA